ncbi:hypothetical protein Ade02nite_24450 [Paractinoplanes deccanensis]|uniref:Uncharacterized protein n=1 Tax=Paractinoplanes deccanensis TaxID=113561 RepID=A0ABQ3Y1C2_9ACTN|nr:hypothetical protein [Actinoplanes deccanensis]GID73804.1 hypothetical protein Ade02nite_24450 [Actinoplanes deccanensis]
MPDREDDLIAELRDLATWLEVPEPADQRAAVRSRIARTARRVSRWKAWVAGLVAAVVGTVIAVAPARAAVVGAVTEVLRVAGIEVRREAAPPPPAASPSPLPGAGDLPLDEARKLVRFPAALGDPERVQLADEGRVVSLFYRGGSIRLDQIDGSAAAFLKQAGQVELTQVGTALAAWLPGPHTLTYIDRAGVERTATARLATPTLIWDDNVRTYRLEGFTDLHQARQVALSMQ